jgi:mannose-1-phosphate guanylyltransferase/mannose-6-phosphate isomerase
MTQQIVPVVLCGGSGTRLWPLSSPQRPKQLLPLTGNRTLLQETLLRLDHLRASVLPPIVVCNERHERDVVAQVDAVSSRGLIVLEPVGRNSAPAATIAALLTRTVAADALLLVLPADHVIKNATAFGAAIDAALEPAAAGYLTTFGVVPTAPATGYGYIRRAAGTGSWSRVAEFAEKPDLATAERYLASGQYLWNSGMFLFSAGVWLEELGRHAPGVLRGCEAAAAEVAPDEAGVVRLGAAFRACPADSIDYAVMEKTNRAAVVPFSAGWSDVGSWSSLHDVLQKDGDGNTVSGDVILDSCRDTYVVAQGRTVAAVGLDGIVIVATDDAILVVDRERAEDVKRIAELVNRKSAETATDKR